MGDKIVHAVFYIAMIALVAKYSTGIASFITNSGNTYANTVKGLQGR